MLKYDTTVERLAIIIADLHPPAAGELRSGGLPRLPALERFLALARRSGDAPDWRAWLQSEWLGLAPSAPAEVAAAALGSQRPAGASWLATPVHRVAGLDTVRVHPQGLVWLAADEQQRLAADFARVFDGAGWTLSATGRRELLLGGEGPAPAAVRSHDPARWRGADPRAGYPEGEGSAPLRRLGAEIEMWLHGHAVNDARAARGELPVDALWLWGGELPPPPPAGGRHAPAALRAVPPAIHGTDLYTRGLAAGAGLAWQEPGEALPAPGAGDLAVVLEVAGGGIPVLERIDAQWIGRALLPAAGRSETLLWVAGQVASLRPAPWRRFAAALRPPRPWWELLA